MANTDIFLARSLDADRERGSVHRHEIARARREEAVLPVTSRWRTLARSAARFIPSLDRTPWGEHGRSGRGPSFVGAIVVLRAASATSEPVAKETSDDELAPIRKGAFASWARSGSWTADGWSIDQPCRMPDGRIGRTAVIEDAGRSELVCLAG